MTGVLSRESRARRSWWRRWKPCRDRSWRPPARARAAHVNRRARDADDHPFQLLVVDEYHWLADAHRGNHYEGVLLSAPPELQLLLLSGAVANPDDVAHWLRRLGRHVEVIQHRERPVQLEEVEVDDLVHGLPRCIEGFWSKRVAGALREGLGPVLVFAPHRADAEGSRDNSHENCHSRSHSR